MGQVVKPDNKALLQRARELRIAGDPRGALAILDAMTGDLRIPHVRKLYADLLAAASEHERFAAHTLESVRQDPTNFSAVNAYIRMNRGLPQDAAALAAALDLATACDEPILWARVAALQMGRGNIDDAVRMTEKAVESNQSPSCRYNMRDQLTSLLYLHGHLDIAEQMILRPGWSSDPLEALWALGRLRKAGAWDDKTLRLLHLLSDMSSPYRDKARDAYLTLSLQINGPSPSLLKLYARWDDGSPTLRAGRLALLLELGDHEQAAALIRQTQRLSAVTRSLLPLCAFLVDNAELQEPGCDTAALQLSASLYKKIVADTQDLVRQCSDPKRTVAVVGSSPKEAGLGNGPRIDRHDIVFRFNKGHPTPQFAQDYGTKTTVHVMPTRGDAKGDPARDAVYTAFAVGSGVYRNRDWDRAHRMAALGFKVASINSALYPALVKELKAPPSKGLRVCAFLHEVRPAKDVSHFGFAFTDQIGENPVSAHFYEAALPSMHHNWKGEARVFDRLFGSRSRT